MLACSQSLCAPRTSTERPARLRDGRALYLTTTFEPCSPSKSSTLPSYACPSTATSMLLGNSSHRISPRWLRSQGHTAPLPSTLSPLGPRRFGYPLLWAI